MKEKIVKKIKYSRFLYKIVSILGSLFLGCVKFFFRVNENKFIFVSYGGKNFDDSPRVILDRILLDRDFEQSTFYISGYSKENLNLPIDERVKFVKIDTIKYFVALFTSKYWITNSSVERGMKNLKKKNNFYLNTWHGVPLKKMGTDIPATNGSFKINEPMPVDAFLTQGEYDTDIFSRVFLINKDKIYKLGLPRNDELLIRDDIDKEKILKKIGLPSDKKIILYAPTFREYSLLESEVMNVDWINELSNDYFVLIRAHYEVASSIKKVIKESANFFDVSKYEHLNDLIVISDMLITDYSSIMFDYSITEKPIVLYCYDYDIYSEQRGLYFDPRKQLVSFEDETNLVSYLNTGLFSDNIDKVTKFKKTYIQEYGNSSTRVVELLKTGSGMNEERKH